MKGTIAWKILAEHLVEGELTPGKEIGIRMDQVLTQDATGTMVYLQFEAMKIESIKCELAVSYVDHNTIQNATENSDDHVFLRTFAEKYGIIFSKPGNGICHQLHLERFSSPGKTLIGSDSHTPTCGGMGMFAVGAGGLDVACSLAGKPYYMTCPSVIKVLLKGRLNDWVSAKDIILEILRRISVVGNGGKVLEYVGDGVKSLDVPERATITNMGAETGVTTSIFPSDSVTKRFLKAQGRESVWKNLIPDINAEYEGEIIVELDKIEPLVAMPHSPGNVVPLRELNGKKVDQVLIGSCTNSSYSDLKKVALILDGHKIKSNVDFGIACGSRQVMMKLAREGLLDKILKSGARLLENACGFCIGNCMAPNTGGVSVRTSNRNFKGRSGTLDAEVFLVSPEVAAVTAIYGKLMDPRDTGLKYPKVRRVRSYVVDDSMFVKVLPSEERKNITVIKGPSIGSVPVGEPFGDNVRGKVTIKLGDNITTDHIIPAGDRLRYRSNIEKYSRYVFEKIDPDFPAKALKNKEDGFVNVIVAGASYGQGSSREHAAMCPMYLGVKVVISKSIERIHVANLINFGILPLVFSDVSDYEKIESGDEIFLHDIGKLLKGDNEITVELPEKRILFKTLLAVSSERSKKIVLEGGLMSFILRRKDS